MKVNVDLKTCKAYANCIVESPDVFDFNDETGKVMLLVDVIEPGMEDDVRRAVAACPVHALSIES